MVFSMQLLLKQLRNLEQIQGVGSLSLADKALNYARKIGLSWKLEISSTKEYGDLHLMQVQPNSLRTVYIPPPIPKLLPGKLGDTPQNPYSALPYSPRLTLYVSFCFWITGTPIKTLMSLTCKASKKRKEPRRLPRGTRQKVELYSISL